MSFSSTDPIFLMCWIKNRKPFVCDHEHSMKFIDDLFSNALGPGSHLCIIFFDPDFLHTVFDVLAFLVDTQYFILTI